MFFEGRPLPPDTAHEAEWRRGRQLVEGLSHCNECHTPRNILGGLDRSRAFGGAPNPEGKGMVPNITPDKSGLADWSKKDIVEVLATGFTPDYDSVGGSMASVVKNMAELPASDREAIATYLKALPPVAGAAKAAKEK